MAIRKNAASLSAAERKNYVDAVKKLKAAPSQFNPPTMGRYDDFVYVHVQAMLALEILDRTKPITNSNLAPNPGMRMPMWAHRCPAFFPWHRELLYQFEKELQRVAGDPNLGIPYWDWSTDQSKTGVPWLNDLMGGDGNNGPVTTGPFAGKSQWPLTLSEDGEDHLIRGFGLDGQFNRLPTPAEVNATLSISVYDGAPWSDKPTLATFRNQTEGWHVPAGSTLSVGMHNLVHIWVGGPNGTMQPSTSPNDPVFFLHHANVDRLWAMWQQRNPGVAHYLPTANLPGQPGQGLNSPMTFYDPALSSTPPWADPPATPAKVVDHHGLGYQYDYETASTAEFTQAVMMTSAKHLKAMKPHDHFKMHLEDLLEGAPSKEEWTGNSTNFSIEEAFKDAISKAPTNLPTDYFRYTITEIGYEEGGFTEIKNLFVKIKKTGIPA